MLAHSDTVLHIPENEHWDDDENMDENVSSEQKR